MMDRIHLQWISKISHPEYEYTLCEKDETLLRMRFNYRHSTYSAECTGPDGDFVIDRKGFFKSTIVLRKNGIETGRLSTKNWWSQSGIAEMEGEKLEFEIGNNPLAEIRFLHRGHLLSVCGFKPANGKLRFNISTTTHFDKHPFSAYLLALSWYILLPGATEEGLDILTFI
jgi:hypothetical protein